MIRNLYKEGYTQNRELSWLRFDERCLNEAKDLSVPLLERMKFVSIFSSNLDEFFSVRVGSLTDRKHLKEKSFHLFPMLPLFFRLCAYLYWDFYRMQLLKKFLFL